MKHGYWKGFATALLLSALVLGLGLSAGAAQRAITVDDNIRITINGATFQPKDANGKKVPLFSYDGTTYAPVRAICEAAGLEVEYDSASYTAVLTTGDVASASRPDSSKYITRERAKEIALDDAGVNAADAVFLKARLDWDDDRAEYDVEFYSGKTEYDYEIDALTGTILDRDQDADDFDLDDRWDDDDREHIDDGTDVISAQKAKEIALNKAPAGTSVIECELDEDDGRLVYELELRNGRTEYECDINAVTGVILDWEVDHDDE
jgi:uncharacterized membrane protein YkoI